MAAVSLTVHSMAASTPIGGGSGRYFVVINPGAQANQSASVIGPYPNYAEAKIQNLNDSFFGAANGYPTQAAAQAEAATWNAHAKGGLPGLSGINAIGDFFNRLAEASTWERVGLGVVGLMLLGIGIVSVASTSKTGQAVKKAAGKMPVIL